MKAHPIPSILSIAAVIVAALVVAVAFGVSTGSPAAQAQTTPVDYDTDNDGLIEINNRDQLDAVRYDLNGNGDPDNSSDDAAYLLAFPDGDITSNIKMGCATACTGYELGRGDELVRHHHRPQRKELDSHWRRHRFHFGVRGEQFSPSRT